MKHNSIEGYEIPNARSPSISTRPPVEHVVTSTGNLIRFITLRFFLDCSHEIGSTSRKPDNFSTCECQVNHLRAFWKVDVVDSNQAVSVTFDRYNAFGSLTTDPTVMIWHEGFHAPSLPSLKLLDDSKPSLLKDTGKSLQARYLSRIILLEGVDKFCLFSENLPHFWKLGDTEFCSREHLNDVHDYVR